MPKYRTSIMPNKHTKVKAEMLVDKKKNASLKKRIAILFVIGCAFTYFEIGLYEQTFIPLIYPLVGWLLAGLLTTCLMNIYISRNENKLAGARIILLMPAVLIKEFFFKSLLVFYLPINTLRFVYCTITFGGIMLYMAMAMNFYFAEKPPIDKQVQIIGIGQLAAGKYGRCRQPYADVNYDNQDKQLIFGCNIDLDGAKRIDLQVEKGAFGFDVIKGQKPVY